MRFPELALLLVLLTTVSPVTSLYSGYTNVTIEGLELPVCHAMEVVDVLADHFMWMDDEDVRQAVVLLAANVCEAYPHLLCTRLTPSPVRDLGQPYHLINKNPTMIRLDYFPLMIADCVSSVNGYSFKDFSRITRTFKTVFQSQSVYLTNMQRCGFKPSVIMDCGAHVGEWTRAVKTHRFPDAKIFMVEANEEHAKELSKLNVPFEITLLAAEDGMDTVYYKNNDPSTSSGNSVFLENSVDNEVAANFRPVHMQSQTIDSLVVKHGLGRVDFLKLDLQGSELSALRGARRTLAGVEVIQAEFHVVNYNEGAPKMLDMYSFLDSEGFAMYDMGEVQSFHLTKIVDGEMVSRDKTVGVDIVFVKKMSTLWETRCTLFPKPQHLTT
mmetsp:Transcript_25973/g.43807  ORF Transcript_25973/g.43807 Transcript_25973/m.43807 type:complete len:383 (+) Transcript_25973:27-1175(+)